MRRALLACALTLWATTAQAALLSHAIKAGIGGGGAATTTAIDTTGATLIVLGAENIGLISSLDLQDSASNTWTCGTLVSGGASRSVNICWVINPTTSATHTFTFKAGNANFCVIAVEAFSNTPAGAFDAETAGGTSAGTTVQPGSLTPANANNLLVTFMGGDAATPITINSSFTTTDTLATVGGTSEGGALAYLIQTAATAQNPTWTVNANGAAIVSKMLAFKENGGGGGGGCTAPPNQLLMVGVGNCKGPE